MNLMHRIYEALYSENILFITKHKNKLDIISGVYQDCEKSQSEVFQDVEKIPHPETWWTQLQKQGNQLVHSGKHDIRQLHHICQL